LRGEDSLNKKAFVIALLGLILGGGSLIAITVDNSTNIVNEAIDIDKDDIEEIAINLNCQWNIVPDEECP